MIKFFERIETPTVMPCRKAFEPKNQCGRLVVPLGFSVLMRNLLTKTRESSLFIKCWVKERLSITNMVGVSIPST